MNLVDLILPTTDDGVAIQVVVVLAVATWAIWRFWSNPEIRFLTFGAALVALGLMGIRALH